MQAEAPPDASEPVGTTTIPPFTLPRERTPTGELEGPRLNTSELQSALRASAPADEPPVAESPAAEIIPDPMDETLVSSSSKDSEAPDSIEDAVAPSTIESTGPFHADEPFAEAEPPVEQQPAAEADLEITSSEPVVEEQESVEIPGIASEDQEPEFPRADTGTGDVPSWIDGITGITDPNILEDFDFAPE